MLGTPVRPGLEPNSAPPPPHFVQKRREVGTPAAGLDFAQFAPPWQLDLLLVALYFPGASICSKWFSIRWNKCVRAAIPAMPCVLPGYTISWNCLPAVSY